jgi:uncharacterized repeat protein (TIGR03803 family)
MSQSTRFSIALIVLLVSATLFAQAQRYRVLSHFSQPEQGSAPVAGLVQDAQGNLYGTTTLGGAFGLGTIFKIARNGTQTTLYSFTSGSDGTDSTFPMVLDAAGNLYGTTTSGGAHGDGTVFKLDKSGIKTTLHDFDQSKEDGRAPTALAWDAQGNLYGTALYGGTNKQGIIFKLTPSGSTWTETILHNFTGAGDGRQPSGTIAFDNAGNLYGATLNGGTFHYGTLYELSSTGIETVLHSFIGNDGAGPQGVIRDSAGNLYGTTFTDTNLTNGLVFKFDTSMLLSVRYFFQGRGDGGGPSPVLLQGPGGELYGTTSNGGKFLCSLGLYGCGVVFKVDLRGRETVLHTFTDTPDGSRSESGVIQDKFGNLYGTTWFGGSDACVDGCGTVFEVQP